MFSNKSENLNKNYEMGYNNINEMLSSSNLIYLHGEMDNKNINIIIDSGASDCIIYKSVLEKCGLINLIDNNINLLVKGSNGINTTLGKIWYLEIKLQLENDEWIIVPICVDVIDDIINHDNHELNNNFELILGMTFLKYYKTKIDFLSMSIILNNNYRIKLLN